MVCEWCRESFKARSSKRRYCTDRCRYAARDRQRHRPKGTELTATCRRCGSGFAYVATTRPRLYCFECSPRGVRFRVAV